MAFWVNGTDMGPIWACSYGLAHTPMHPCLLGHGTHMGHIWARPHGLSLMGPIYQCLLGTGSLLNHITMGGGKAVNIKHCWKKHQNLTWIYIHKGILF